LLGQAQLELHNVAGRDRRSTRAPGRPVDPTPLSQRCIGIRLLAGRPAAAFDQVAPPGARSPLVLDVARAVAGSAVGKPSGWLICF